MTIAGTWYGPGGCGFNSRHRRVPRDGIIGSVSVTLTGPNRVIRLKRTASRADILAAIKEPEKEPGRSGRQIVGFSLTPEFAAEVKAEAARRNLSLQELLRELWDLYKAKSSS